MNDSMIHLEKLQALFLNKVEGLKWYYFDLDLNADFVQQGSLPNQAQQEYRQLSMGDQLEFLDKIELRNGTYFYKDSHSAITSPEKKESVLTHLLAFVRSYPEVPRQVVRRLFDSNHPDIANHSNHKDGLLGLFNRKDQERRNRIFKRKIRGKVANRFGKRRFDGFRSVKGNMVVMAEGDSWFEFPSIFIGKRRLINPVKDIIDHLMEEKSVAVYSIAAGGDWLSNMLRAADYIEELPKVSPDIFMFSGGGNDMLGDYRLATMVRSSQEGPRQLSRELAGDEMVHALLKKRTQLAPESFHLNIDLYRRGLSWLTDEFFEFINITMAQYFLLVAELQGLEKYKHMMMITQGYDFPLPSRRRRGGLLQRLLNNKLDSGKWLFDPMMMKGITDPVDQQAVVYAMIHEFNEMLIQLASYKGFPNLFHIDCRGVAENESDWYDEIHLENHGYERIAQTYLQCMKENLYLRNGSTNKVYRVEEKKQYSLQTLTREENNPPLQRRPSEDISR